MRHWISFGGVVFAMVGALVWSEQRHVEAPVGPEPILDIVGDTEHELSRLPVKFVPLSDAEEIKIGNDLEKRYVPIWRQSEDQARDRSMEAYVQEMGGRVAAHAHRKLPYGFHYIPSLDFVNAFALPGGPVFIGGGLMALMDTEDELASVLAHEIEHIDHYHPAERVQIQSALQKVPLGELVGIPVEVFVAGYSKSQELEADREGAKLAVTALYAPQGSIQMFQAFERFEPTKNLRSKTPQEELSQVALQTLEGYFRSHPLNAERTDQIQKMIAGGQLPNWQKTKPMPVAYLFLTERAWRFLQLAQTAPYAFPSDKDKRKREAERNKQYQEAIRLASQSLGIHADQPRASEIVAVAHFGLGDYEAAVEVYRNLVPKYPTFADGIRAYADSMAQAALQAQHYDQTKKLALVSLTLQPNRPEALKFLLEAQLQVGDFAGASETATALKVLDPRSGAEVSTYAGRLAAAAFVGKRFEDAAAIAKISADLKPDQWESVATLAKAQFALADFSGAAKSYRRLLDLNPLDTDVVRSYADSLAADKPNNQEAGEWLAHVRVDNPVAATQVRVELAGVLLTTGDDRPAQAFILDAQGGGRNRVAPELLGRLGWWYYRAGKYSTSADLLRQAIAQRPGDLTLQAALGFDEVEEHQMDDAIRLFTVAAGDSRWNSPLMGRAVARWQTSDRDEALKDFDAVTKASPEWRNPRWVQALYSATVAQSVSMMLAKWGKRVPSPH